MVEHLHAGSVELGAWFTQVWNAIRWLPCLVPAVLVVLARRRRIPPEVQRKRRGDTRTSRLRRRIDRAEALTGFRLSLPRSGRSLRR